MTRFDAIDQSELVLEQGTIRYREPVLLSNVLVQLQAQYDHCGEPHPKSA